MRSRSILAVAPLLVFAMTTTAACLDRPIKPQDPRSTAMVMEPIKLSGVERIDLLLAIDNSASMGDKQDILARAVPDLVRRLANPSCVDSSGVPTAVPPASPTAPCPAGTEREFQAVPDIHVGIVSSSIGYDGSACKEDSKNDHAHLLSRTEGGGSKGTYQGFGFLAWDPDKKLDPPGESVLDAGSSGLIPSLQDMVRGVGETGCGYESQLESWYRFLVEPDPAEKLEVKGSAIVRSEKIDKVLLDERKQFLRPDSLLAIVMLTDENDCSIAPGPDAARMLSGTHMVKARAVCQDSPDDKCCAPCDEIPDGCGEDASCKDDSGNIARLSPTDDGVDLRCFDQKRRFGKSYLHPLSRYVKGLNDRQVPDRFGNMVANPLYQDLNADDDLHEIRNSGLVFLTGIVGVPWQDIAKNPNDLTQGLKSAKEMQERNVKGFSAWDIILGDPQKGIAPQDPHMREQSKPRDGENPATGTSIAPPGSGPGADPISGHEQPLLPNNLQFACTFPLAQTITCNGEPACDCNKPDGNPLCQDDSGAYSKTQTHAKAYPGLRELGVLQGVGDQAIVASVCPANMNEAAEKTAPDFGYRPAIGALIDRLKGKLGYQCLPRQLTPHGDGQVSCLVIEARKSESCTCSPEDGRAEPTHEHLPAIDGARGSGVVGSEDNCFCEVPQLDGKELSACQNQKADPLVVDGEQANGWCYVDATSLPPVGSPELVPDSCASTERRLVRFVGTAKAKTGSTLVIMCSEG